MSNYNAPFDFDGDKFLYIVYYDESIRCINIYTFTKKKKFNYLIDKKSGHITHMKLLPNDCIFLCRNYSYVKYINMKIIIIQIKVKIIIILFY